MLSIAGGFGEFAPRKRVSWTRDRITMGVLVTGSAFATAETQMIVATVVQRYRLTLLPGARVVPAAGLTLRPSPGLPMRAHRQ